MNIRNSMYRLVFILVVLPFLLFSLLITQIYSDRLEKAITESLRVVADAQVAEMTNFCEQQKDYLMLIGSMDVSHEAMKGKLDKETGQYLDNILSSHVKTISYMDTLTIIGKDHRVIACSNKNHRLFADDGINTLIKNLGQKEFYISDVLTNVKKQKILVEISRIEDDGALLGYALAEINPDFYKNIRERAELWDKSTFYLLDGQQKIISAGTPDEDRDSFVTTAEDRKDYNEKYNAIDFEKNPQGSFQYELGGQDYITYYSNVNYTDWRFLLTVNLKNYQAQKTVFYSLACFIVLLGIVLAILIGWFSSKRIVRPIKSISGTLRDIQETQDYTLRAEVGRKDELGSLASEINELIEFIETEDLYKTQQQRLLREKAGQDALTKALNKERINETLEDSIVRHREHGSSMALLFVDIDNFKDFNSNYGHNVGDQVLLFLAALLARETGGKVGRIGGDEFLVIVETPEYVRNLDACLRQVETAAASQFTVRDSGVRLSISCCIGAVRVDFSQGANDELTGEVLIDMADNSMYRVKNNGKCGHSILDYRYDLTPLP